MKDVEEYTDRVREKFSGQTAGLMPEVSATHLFDVKPVAQLSYDSLNKPTDRCQRLHEGSWSRILHVRPERGLKVDTLSGQFSVQGGADVTFVADEQSPDAVEHVGQCLAVTNVGRGQREGCNHTLHADKDVAAETVEGLLCGLAVTVGRMAAEHRGEAGSGKAAYWYREAVYQVRVLIEGGDLSGNLMLEPLLPIPKVRCLPGECGSVSQLREQVLPVPSKVFPNALVGIEPQEFSHDLHRDDFGVREGGGKTSSPQLPAPCDCLQIVVNQTVHKDDKIFDRQHNPPLSKEVAGLPLEIFGGFFIGLKSHMALIIFSMFKFGKLGMATALLLPFYLL